jgi:hypothetical protein
MCRDHIKAAATEIVAHELPEEPARTGDEDRPHADHPD